MKSTLNKTNDVNGTIVIELEKTDYQDKVDKSVNQYRQKANIPGFRQGKVPKNLIRKLYGKALLVDEINKILSEGLQNFIQDNNLKILGEPIPADNLDEELDLENDETLSFSFDVALKPNFDLKLDKSVELTYYNIKLEQEKIDQQVESHRQYYGKYITIDEEIQGSDMVKGTLVEMDGENEKEDGEVIENAVLIPTYLKDEEIKNRFIGAKTGDKIVFNPKKAYDNNEAEIASLLQTTKEKVANIDADFRFDINEVTRFKEAELDQELFDNVLGEGVVTSEEEFRKAVETRVIYQFKPHADYLFMHETRDLILKMMEDVEFPVEMLKRWILTVNKTYTAENLELEFPSVLDGLKFQIAKQKIIDENGIKVEFEEIEAAAIEKVRLQFAQYGISNLPSDMMQNYTKKMLENEETLKELYDRASEYKIIDWLKKNVTVVEKEISSQDFNDLIVSHSHNKHSGKAGTEDESNLPNASQEVDAESDQADPNDATAATEEQDLTQQPENKENNQ